MPPTEGKSTRINGLVRFQLGHRYSSFGRTYWVEIVPVLGAEVAKTDKYDLRYITYQPGRWFIFFSQFGTYRPIENAVETADIAKLVDLAAFLWRQRRTNTFWLMHPMDMLAQRYPDELYPFEFDYYAKSGYLYFVEAADLERVRIGWTASPNQRPGELVRHNPYPLNFFALLPGERSDEAHLQYTLCLYLSPIRQ